MKKVLCYSFLLSLLFLLNSCTPEESELITSTSEDGEMIVSVQGSRYSSMDPFNVKITVAVNDKTIEASTEVYADKLDATNVDFNWQDNRNCVVNFTQRDGKVNSVPISIQD